MPLDEISAPTKVTVETPTSGNSQSMSDQQNMAGISPTENQNSESQKQETDISAGKISVSEVKPEEVSIPQITSEQIVRTTFLLIAVSQNKVPFQSMQYMRNYKQDHLV